MRYEVHPVFTCQEQPVAVVLCACLVHQQQQAQQAGRHSIFFFFRSHASSSPEITCGYSPVGVSITIELNFENGFGRILSAEISLHFAYCYEFLRLPRG